MTETRREELAKQLVQYGALVTKDLARRYGVSTETIRKDILYLEQMGIAQKTRGGAMYVNDAREIPFHHTSVLNQHEKALIAQKAMDLISGNLVILDAGSTTLAVAKLLSLRENLTVVTSSLSALPILTGSPGVNVVLTGGEARHVSQDLVGFWAERSLREVNADVGFIGANSLAGTDGPTTASLSEVAIKRAILQASRLRYLVVDSSKLMVVSTYQFADWKDFTGIITDAKIPAEFVEHVSRFTSVIVA